MMQPWFKKAKLGIFVHWGIYAVDGRGSESWPIVQATVSYNDYYKQMNGFTADAYKPKEWAQLIKTSGAKYAVLTTKHHDGVTLWPTNEEGPCIPRERDLDDLVQPFLEALREESIHTGLYFSHTDWAHEPHFEVITGLNKASLEGMKEEITSYKDIWTKSFEEEVMMDEAVLAPKWQTFLDFEKRQIAELLTSYGTIDLLWFDVLLHRPGYGYKCKELKAFIEDLSPRTIVNSRLENYGDYETPEQFIPVYPPDGPWEVCLTTNDTWSYTGREKDYKTPFEVITMFCECLGMGGNMLLNVGPDEKGIIPQEQVAILKSLGHWIRKHEEAVYETVRGLPHGYSYGMTSLNKAQDIIYLYLSHIPNGTTAVKGIRNKVKKVQVLANGAICSHKRIGGAAWLNVPGTLWIDIPKAKTDHYVTVLKIELEGQLDLYNGVGIEIDVN